MKRSRKSPKKPPAKKQKVSNLVLTPKSEEVIPDIEEVPMSWKENEIKQIRANLLDWYDSKELREMPWRVSLQDWEQKQAENENTKEETVSQRAYEVWVSEIMLQQTRVQTVISYFTKWMQKFPTVKDLASASLEEVNEVWAGLGYYRRANFLHQGAQKVVSEYNEKMPRSAQELLKLPGIGKYTAGAVASIVYRETTPVVDGNVIRVLSRLQMITEDPKKPKTQKLLWELSGKLVDPKRPGCFNQALMDLGSTLCTVRTPECEKCPLKQECKAFQASIQPESSVLVTNYPTKVAKTAQRLETVSCCIISSGKSTKRYLIIQRPSSGLLASLWEFPSCILSNPEDKPNIQARKQLQQTYLRETLGFRDISLQEQPKQGKTKEIKRNFTYTSVGKISHEFSHIKQTLLVDFCHLLAEPKRNEDKKLPNIRWVTEEEIKTAAVSKGMQKCFKSFLTNSKSNQTFHNSLRQILINIL